MDGFGKAMGDAMFYGIIAVAVVAAILAIGVWEFAQWVFSHVEVVVK